MDLSPPPLSRIALDRWIALRFPGVRTVTTDELARSLAAGAPGAPVLVDVRADDERAVSVIPGAFGARELSATGLTRAELELRDFRAVVRARHP